jgi:hypothetical protein
MDDDGSVTRLILLIRSDDPAEREMASRLIWLRSFRDLLELARNNLDRRIRRREVEEDVLKIMCKSFRQRQQRGEFDLTGRDALWSLLKTITLRKARNVAKRQARYCGISPANKPCPTITGRDRPIVRSSRWMPPAPCTPRRPCLTSEGNKHAIRVSINLTAGWSPRN